MDIVVCIKRVPAFGAQVPLTDDGSAVDTRHLGFTIGPHEECAVEEAVRLTAKYGGRVTVLTVGPQDAGEQLRYALAMGAHQGVLVDTGTTELDPEATATAVLAGLADEPDPDLLLFGDASADAGHGQVGVRVALARGLPVVGGITGLDAENGSTDGNGDAAGNGAVSLRASRDTPDGTEVFRLPVPAVVAVKEGLNLPRYPTLPGRLKAKKAALRTVACDPEPGGLHTVGLRRPADDRAGAIPLGRGADAAPAVVDVLAELGKV
ncbi:MULTISPECIES: electron transfer flavoprotein subunit beta/FixA family protein [Prauserella salsuginis group]|uniref:Electron transfer flavoprotein beta subunit n=2 Tax=Prauserella salsuginis group TaxID=2893672 RepID=A0A839XSE0_9PSEU|nr:MULTISPECIES: electron transfer flavoprotein subunit beta/FixA family protein [Prauserella salsuginis group]MBB3665667.1 electron transfer flavoprotein beta subunit [Prauserella sediminis]MCR3722859.1 electron transfer flavoprotein beta subunit [Prauserella flava]MCR3737466.1 electron transfer flavoprotein beta subunit [Prauserella salsuginis]